VERGRLYVFSRDPDYAWTETRQKLVRLVADQTSVAIENDELTVALRKKERLDRELEIGAEIQLQLLPRECPVIDGMDLAAKCQTAHRVGGDYYDFIPTTFEQFRHANSPQSAAESWSFAIGDVMGKGVPAGLIMTMMRGMLRAEVLNGHSPAKILQHLNFVMHSDLENSNRFVTLFYAEYNPQTRLLSYGNAAHNPPFCGKRPRTPSLAWIRWVCCWGWILIPSIMRLKFDWIREIPSCSTPMASPKPPTPGESGLKKKIWNELCGGPVVTATLPTIF
jgi:sigma-B regulation protein RsbU (phosphoserine phosphatase)